MSHADDEFRLTLKVRNHPLLSAIEAQAETVADFCRQHNLSQSEVGEYLNLRKSPQTKTGAWREGVNKLSDACGMAPEDLFPAAVQVALTKNEVSYSVAAHEAAALLEPGQRPDALLEGKEIPAEMRRALRNSDLNEREREVLAGRYGLNGEEISLDDLGRMFDVTRERIRQIEAKALRKLRHPSRREPFAALLPEGYQPAAEPQDTFGMQAWVQQAVEQGLACAIPKDHPARWEER